MTQLGAKAPEQLLAVHVEVRGRCGGERFEAGAIFLGG